MWFFYAKEYLQAGGVNYKHLREQYGEESFSQNFFLRIILNVTMVVIMN